MRAFLATGVLAVVTIIAFSRILGPSIDPDTPVVVNSADPIKVILPAEPDAETIERHLYADMIDAADRARGRLGDDLRAMARDADLIDWIATSGAAKFARNEAAALAYPLYATTVSPELVTISTSTVELLPQHWALGYSIGHEDGHAIINRELAEECGPVLLARFAGDGQRASAIESSIQNALYDLGDEAHAHYHLVVNGSRAPAFAREAREAAALVIEDGC